VDLLCPRTDMQNAVWTSLYRCVEPVLSSWPVNKLRDRALYNLMEHIHYEDENTQYVCICAVNKVNNVKSLTPHDLPKLYCHSVVVFLLVILLLYDLVYTLL